MSISVIKRRYLENAETEKRHVKNDIGHDWIILKDSKIQNGSNADTFERIIAGCTCETGSKCGCQGVKCVKNNKLESEVKIV